MRVSVDNSKGSSKGNEQGFTLVEVAIAIAILGLAFATLISFQISLVDTAGKERNRFKATLAAQYLLSFYEIMPKAPPLEDVETDLTDELKAKGYFDTAEPVFGSQNAGFTAWRLRRKVTSIDYAEFKDVLRRVELRVFWGEQETESLALFLFFENINVAPKKENG